MISLSTLKRDLEISRGLGDIVDVLKMAAVIQFHALQEKEKPEALFLDDVEACISLLLSQETTNPFFMRRQGRPSLIVLLTSDEGFLGELNSVLINAALEQKRGADDEIVVLGDRGARALDRRRARTRPGIRPAAAWRRHPSRARRGATPTSCPERPGEGHGGGPRNHYCFRYRSCRA